MIAILKRELRSYFTSPLGYTILAVLLFFSGLYYSFVFSNGQADMSYVFSGMVTIVFFVIPVLTMRLFSEEKHQKTDQLFMTAPVSIFSVVIGKFLAALSFFGVYLGILLVYNFAFYFFGGSPDWLIFFGNFVGTILFASSLIAIGIFISSLTESQVVAAVGSFAVSFFLLLLSTFSALVNNELITKICNWISFSERYDLFSRGIFEVSNIVFFLSVVAIFLFLTIRVLDRKRWA